MREKLCGLFDEGGGPGVLAKKRERRGTAAKVSDHAHEFGDEAHDRLSRLPRAALPTHGYESPARSSSRTLSMSR